MTTLDSTEQTSKTKIVPAREIFLKWEMLRILYNALLAAVVLIFVLTSGGLRMFTETGLILLLIPRALLVNVCFMAGPGVEAYAAWLGWRTRWLRPILFALGLVFSVGLTLLSLALFGLSGMD